MKFTVPVVVLVLFSNTVSGQDFRDSHVQSLLDAERAFIRMAKAQNTRDAFFQFLADDAITASPGEGPRKGKEHLKSQAPNEGYLHWVPVYTDVAASEDFGYNTGPWEFRQKKTDVNAVAFGQFVSMWKKNTEGEWRVAIDIGISHDAPKAVPPLTTSSFPLSNGLAQSLNPEVLFEVEKQFIDDYGKSGNSAYLNLLCPETRFFRPGKFPLTTRAEIEDFLKLEPSNVHYEFMDGEVASSGDLAYVYGKIMVTDVQGKSRYGSYLRFYKKADSNNWKLVVDLLTH